LGKDSTPAGIERLCGPQQQGLPAGGAGAWLAQPASHRQAATTALRHAGPGEFNRTVLSLPLVTIGAALCLHMAAM